MNSPGPAQFQKTPAESLKTEYEYSIPYDCCWPNSWSLRLSFALAVAVLGRYCNLHTQPASQCGFRRQATIDPFFANYGCFCSGTLALVARRWSGPSSLEKTGNSSQGLCKTSANRSHAVTPNHSLNRKFCGAPAWGSISFSPKAGAPQNAG